MLHNATFFLYVYFPSKHADWHQLQTLPVRWPLRAPCEAPGAGNPEGSARDLRSTVRELATQLRRARCVKRREKASGHVDVSALSASAVAFV